MHWAQTISAKWGPKKHPKITATKQTNGVASLGETFVTDNKSAMQRNVNKWCTIAWSKLGTHQKSPIGRTPWSDQKSDQLMPLRRTRCGHPDWALAVRKSLLYCLVLP
jgi:hypothetical protein